MVKQEFSFNSPTGKLGLYAVVPDFAWVKKVADLGIKTIQLRMKTTEHSLAEIKQHIAQSVDYTQGKSIQLFINDYWQLAIEHSAYGVHLGQEDLLTANLEAISAVGLRLGISTHTDAEFLLAKQIKPSYIACGAVYPTTTKMMKTKPLGLEELERYIQWADNIPVVAIGGIFLDNAREIIQLGVSGIAVVRAITEAENLPDTICQFQNLLANS